MNEASKIPLSLHDFLQRVPIGEGKDGTVDVLDKVTVRSTVLQDFRPLAESLEWELATLYWRGMGVDAFAQSEVPFVINNDGQASEAAAATFYTWCREHDGQLPERLVLLELGAGTGLFARFFLDAFENICRHEKADYYHRLQYLVTDNSPRTVEQWQERGMFAPHAPQCALAVCNALQPGTVHLLSGEPLLLQDIQAIFCNYLLDVLPAAVVRNGESGPEQLTVRTCLLDDSAIVAQYTPLSLQELKAIAESDNPEQRRRLLQLLSLLELETRFEPLNEDSLPFLAQTLAWGNDLERILFNYGAFAALDAFRTLLGAGGFILINDYGPTRREDISTHTALQRFGGSAAQGINFPLLMHYAELHALQLLAPPGDDDRAIHTRMLTVRAPEAVREMFENRFSKDASDHCLIPREQARRHQAAGRRNEALEAYKLALSCDPRNWSLIGEAAEFIALQLRDFNVGLELARSAIERNPWYSTWLWNILGDCLYCLQRYADAHEAYLQAERIDAKDARTQLNLAYTLFQQGGIEAALVAIARGLAGDSQGLYRSRLIEKQEQILMAAASRWLGEQERLSQRASRFQ